MQIDVTVQDANNILCEVTPPQPQIIVIDRGVEGNGIVSIVPVTISTFQYLRITYTNGTVQDVGPLTSTAYTATAPITIVGNTISLATVPIASGGTDATTAAGAIQNLLPSYTGNANKRLGLNSLGTALEWVLDGGGTVTSVAASGGTTGLTFTGSPITTSGTLTLGGTLAVANGGTGVTSSTGTGSVVLSTSPTLVTPVLGTPTSGNFSTGTFTWPTFNQNTTGTAANITATSNSTLTTLSALSLPGSQVSGNISGNAANVTGVVAIANGGTGQTTANAALNALLPTQTGNASKYLQTDGTNATWDAISLSTADITGILPTANGGTGLSSFTANRVLYTSSTSAIGQSANLTFDGTNFVNGGNFSTGTSGLATYFRSSGTAYTQIGDNQTLGAGTAFVIGSSTPYLAGNVAGGEQMRLTTTGLGIGTSSPTVKLDVLSAITNGYTPIVRLTRPSATLNDQFLAFYNGIATDAQIGRLKNSDDLLFGFNSGVSFSAAMTLATSGNLGIGVSAPSVKLSVAGDAIVGTQNDTRLLLSNGSISEYYTSETTPRWFIGRDAITGGQAGIGFGPTSSVSIATGGSAVGIPTTRTLGFFTSNGTSLTERARIDQSGNFGINTSSPVYKLDVVGTSGNEVIARFTAAGTDIDSQINLAPTGVARGIINATANGLALAVAGSTKAVVNSSGNFGIGITSPSAKLDVSGGSSADVIKIRGRTSDNFGLLLFATSAGTANAYIGSTDSTNLTFYTNGFTERARIDSAGNFGVGITDATQKIQTNGRIRVTSNNTNGGDMAVDQGGLAFSSLSTTPIVFERNNFGSESARFDGSGNFGIGTTSPAGKLDVFSNTGTTAPSARFYVNASGNTPSSLQGFAIYNNVSGGFVDTTLVAGNTANTYMAFGIHNGTSYSESARINNSGNVGIGTSSPARRLDVATASGNCYVGISRASKSTGQVALQLSGGTSGTDWIIYQDINSDDLKFFGNSGERMVLNSSGNLGIGTSSPSSKLTVVGTVKSASGTQSSFYLSNAAQTNGFLLGRSLGSDDAQNFFIYDTVAGATRLYLDSSGNLGIGTSSPAAKLDVSQTTAGSNAAKILHVNGNGIFINPSYNYYDAYNHIFRSLNGTTTYATIDNNGNLGIGTTSPSEALEISRTTDPKIRFVDVGNLDAKIGIVSSTALGFEVNGSERARINSSGQFLIGATAGATNERLRVIGPAVAGASFAARFAQGNYADGYSTLLGLGVESSAWSKGAIGFVRTTSYDVGDIVFCLNSNASGTADVSLSDERMRITSGGNLLVGTTSQLGVGKVNIAYAGASQWGMAFKTTGQDNSTAIVFRNSTDTSVGSIQTTTSATSYVTSSDYRLKNTIAPMIGALAKVALLKPCTYKWNVDGSDGQGFIAHELAEVVPQCVTGEKDAVDANGKPQYQGIDTSFLVATLTAAIQEQQEIINQLKARLDAANL